MTYKIKFGTNGWRGVIAEDYTFDNVRRCAQGFADYLRSTRAKSELRRGVVVGGDRRFNSEHFAAAAAEVRIGLSFGGTTRAQTHTGAAAPDSGGPRRPIRRFRRGFLWWRHSSWFTSTAGNNPVILYVFLRFR